MPLNISLAEFRRIKRLQKAKRDKRVQKCLDNQALEAAQDALGCPPRPGRATNDPIRTKRQKSDKIRPISAQNRIKQIKRQILGTGALWSQAVRRRDRKCVMCGKTEGLQAHHWLFRRAHSMALAVDIANGATLCYGCHMGRIHHDGDGDFVLRLADEMRLIVGAQKVEEMRITARTPHDLDLAWWEEKLDGFLGR